MPSNMTNHTCQDHTQGHYQLNSSAAVTSYLENKVKQHHAGHQEDPVTIQAQSNGLFRPAAVLKMQKTSSYLSPEKESKLQGSRSTGTLPGLCLNLSSLTLLKETNELKSTTAMLKPDRHSSCRQAP